MADTEESNPSDSVSDSAPPTSSGSGTETFCSVCNVNCRTNEKYQAHLQSDLHRTISKMRDTSTEDTSTDDFDLDASKKTPLFGNAPPTFARNNSRGSHMSRGMPMRGRGPHRGGRGWAGGYPPYSVGGRGRGRGPTPSQTLYSHFVKPSAEGGPPSDKPDADVPDDSMKKGAPSPRKKFHCEVCDATMSGPESFEQHIKGGKHKKALQKSGAAVVEKKVQPVKYRCEKSLQIQTALDVVTMPLVGLQYLVEFQNPDSSKDPIYECYLCDSQMDVRNVIAHITGLKHKHTYLKIHYSHLLKDVHPPDIGRMPRSGERKNIILQHVDEIAATEGRQKVSVYVWDGKTEKPDVHTGAGPAIKRTAPFPNTGPAAKKQVGGECQIAGPLYNNFSQPGAANAGGTSALMKLVEALEGFEIANEVQAGLILKINVSLSNALKKYRHEPVTETDFDNLVIKSERDSSTTGDSAASTATGTYTTPSTGTVTSTKKPVGAEMRAPGGGGPRHPGPRPPPPPPQSNHWNYDNSWYGYGYGGYGYDNQNNYQNYGYGYRSNWS